MEEQMRQIEPLLLRQTRHGQFNIRISHEPTIAEACKTIKPMIIIHSHELIDLTVAIFVVQNRKVLLILHRKLNKWLPLGGHIELDEDPEIASLREAREESGFEVELIG